MDVNENNQIILDGIQFKINASSGIGVYSKIMQSIWSQLKASLSHHNKVAVLRFDLHLAKGSEVVILPFLADAKSRG